MACEGCEERRRKIKALYDLSKESIANTIAQLSGRSSKAKQSSDSAEQPADSTDNDTDSSNTGAATQSRTRRTRKKPT
jgi:hypothetical protein